MKLARPKRGEPFTKPFCVELRFVWTSLAWRNVATLIGKALRVAEAFKCSWKGMWRSSTHPDRLRMFSPGLWRQKNPSLHWALPMELLNILDTAAYSVWLSSFVSMSSPQDHCQFLSAIFRHLVQNQLFHTGAFWWSPYVLGHARPRFLCGLGYLTPTAGFPRLNSMIYSLSPLSTSSGSWPRYFELISGLCRSLNKDWGRLRSLKTLFLWGGFFS